MTIHVVNKRGYDGQGIPIYIGRPSIFGNPFSHLKGKTLARYKTDTREESIAAYREHFDDQIKNNKVFKLELDKIKNLSRDNDVYLICWCKPLSCHGDLIKVYLDWLD